MGFGDSKPPLHSGTREVKEFAEKREREREREKRRERDRWMDRERQSIDMDRETERRKEVTNHQNYARTQCKVDGYKKRKMTNMIEWLPRPCYCCPTLRTVDYLHPFFGRAWILTWFFDINIPFYSLPKQVGVPTVPSAVI
jgi:hypothetical protein